LRLKVEVGEGPKFQALATLKVTNLAKVSNSKTASSLLLIVGQLGYRRFCQANLIGPCGVALNLRQ
jgi:hypothetical protein